MPCSITDSQDYDDWLESGYEPRDEDEAYEEWRNDQIDADIDAGLI